MQRARAGLSLRTFESQELQNPLNTDMITLNVIYDSKRRLILGEAAWDLSGLPVISYIECVQLGFQTAPGTTRIAASSTILNCELKSGNTLMLNLDAIKPVFSSGIFEVALIVFMTNGSISLVKDKAFMLHPPV
jgi:hypothetical protein